MVAVDLPIGVDLSIGVDLGTTRSGISIHVSAPTERYSEFLDLKKLGGPKFPTEVTYDSSRWGNQCQEFQSNTFRWFKLLLQKPARLDNNIRSSRQYKDALLALELNKKKAAEVAQMYLEKLWEQALPHCNEALDDLIAEREWGRVKIRSVRVGFTHPVMWKTGGITSTREAIFASLRSPWPTAEPQPLSEPEAAACYLLKQAEVLAEARVGHVMIVCDIGGGTIDVARYGIKSLNPPRVKQLGDTHGAFGGGVVLDNHFETWLKTELQKEDGPYPGGLNLTDDEIGKFMRKTWENKKVRHGTDGGPYTLRLPETWPNKGTHSSIQLSEEHRNSIFDPVVGATYGFLDSSVQQAIADGHPPSVGRGGNSGPGTPGNR
ncbi:hypothetical protein GGTG_02105 [Gaeumannomyces tritici R3-111a-1]|uniref:Hsp70-like protein n=1 Tax=Gaeumannomyces tritici (strain R3-111a-1) TaxID=644352 RepID=J3NLF6_GAET3|nr:hypothetical protein GGTG_02105 [Gaeumannomyces tritici R3-111a-1]EJT82131.1 hypothetical protein GGTG_02105 [Gaeumannomyces tritici R3-111a-1]